MSKTRRHIILCTDDPQEAFDMLRTKKKEEPEKEWSMADIRNMIDPPKTIYRWIVFRLIED